MRKIKSSLEEYAKMLRAVRRAEIAAARYILAAAREGQDMRRVSKVNMSTHPEPETFVSYVAAQRDYANGTVRKIYEAFQCVK